MAMHPSFRDDDVRGDVEAESAGSVGVCVPEHGQMHSFFTGASQQHGPAQAVTAAPGTGLPCGSSTRPTTNIRPGAAFGFASSGFAATRCLPIGRRDSSGSSFIASARCQIARAGRDGAEEQQGHRDEFQLVDNMDRSTSWARAVAEASGGGGLSGRELDRGPGRDVAQGG